ncbi:hypothetical protein CR203_23415 [Salipaludibacillus neizhouensis]|uniref:Butirosin biosynthesis protein H N-terminal domain-containing protein n=1 Tax=Salipaludibacillus neizhouensis TaxID=885475 RepID=A0A3A9K214_9BACI|nr:hypothetical protein [Salipaludibacillus neizhouensis]RKL64960.1 hypothetical protein CR203_23415 [Salipaludibacillus neizhouensis]
MSLKKLNYNYISEDHVYPLVNDCIERSIYLVAKQKTNFGKHLYKLFVSYLSYNLSIDHNGKNLRLKPSEIQYPEFISLRHEYNIKFDAKTAINKLEKTLNENKFVLLRTVTKRVPFFSRYDKDYIVQKKDLIKPGHFILLIGHDQKYLYYVDRTEDLNLNNHTAYKKNPDVGMVEKRKMIDAFSYYIDISTINVNIHELDNFLKHDSIIYIMNNINKSIDQYKDTKVLEKDDQIIFPNKKAIEYLISLSKKGNTFLNTEYKTASENKIVNGLDWILKRRKILKYFIETQKIECNNELIHLLNKNINNIEVAKNTLIINMLNKDWLFDLRYTSLFKDVLESENTLINELQNYTRKINK